MTKKKPAKKKPVEEPVEVVETAPITLDDVVNRATGIWNNARNQGVSSVTRRLCAGLEGFFGGLTGDDEKKPPRKG